MDFMPQGLKEMTKVLQDKTLNFCSGIGQYHTNEYDPKKPDKKLTPYLEIGLSTCTGYDRKTPTSNQAASTMGDILYPSKPQF